MTKPKTDKAHNEMVYVITVVCNDDYDCIAALREIVTRSGNSQLLPTDAIRKAKIQDDDTQYTAHISAVTTIED